MSVSMFCRSIDSTDFSKVDVLDAFPGHPVVEVTATPGKLLLHKKEQFSIRGDMMDFVLVHLITMDIESSTCHHV
jgi:hypothetical protein